MKIFASKYLTDLTGRAKKSPRLRENYNIHKSYQDPVQRLFNAIEFGSYIRPHRHLTEPREELLIAIRGYMALITFDDSGCIKKVLHLGSEKYGDKMAVGVELSPDTWHTVVALQPGCLILEIKAGPFLSCQSKDFAKWAPEEGSIDATNYLHELMVKIDKK